MTPERLAEIRTRLDSTRGDLPADPRCPDAVPNLHMVWYAQDVGELVALAERTQFVRDNGPALLEGRDSLIARQRAELAKLNQRCAALTAERDRLRALNDHWEIAGAYLADTKARLEAEVDRLKADLENERHRGRVEHDAGAVG